MKRTLLLLAAGACALLLAPVALQAQVLYGSFPLSGAEEVPANASLNSGEAEVTLDLGTNTVSWSLSFTMAASAAHIHAGSAGTNGGVLVNLGVPGATTGSAVVSAAQAAAIQAGDTYINVHTAAFPGGELRGQVRLAWEDLGGSFGSGPPELVGGGPLVAGSDFQLDLADAPPSALGLAWLSFAPVPTPYFGGVVHASPFNLQLFIATNAAGEVSIGGVWPTTVPAGTVATLQMIISDPSLPGGLALSNGLRLRSF